ncbi:glycoside hydrolase family 97 protein [Acetobacteroides hydrogenigenes]|uniref:Alpha-glucosidase n=1 Tax=Acetobacteroides hydrogenigenes TaxID=979970 RepID=A0A4R2E5H5_9BACT|nr:glycoside hydrolase family 97 protein [Acetobacteroides hydrogenigenes]TCN63071.1 alpha-glucosidase [Acetobacteroides hydrogenigenes]
MKRIYTLAVALLLLCQTGLVLGAEATLRAKSPNGRVQVSFVLQKGTATYSLTRNGKEVIAPSSLGFTFRNMPEMKGNLAVVGSSSRSINEKWEQPWGERRWITNSCGELVVKLREKSGLKRAINVTFRVFDDGLGFRYTFPKQPNIDSLIIASEETEFSLPTADKAWWTPVHGDNSYYESIPRHTAIAAIDTVNTPATIETRDGLYLAIHEANLTDYASMTLLNVGKGKLRSELVPWSNGVKVYAKAPFSTPWRTVIVADKPGDLITSNIMLNLNEPCKLKDISWVKPAKYIGVWWGMHINKYTWGQGSKHGATTKIVKEYIDFAAANGFAGVLVEGWNEGWDYDWSKEGYRFSFTKAYPDFDLPEICRYAASKNVKLIGHHETGGFAANYEKQLEDAFKLYQQNGVSCIKTGYVNKYIDGKEWHDSQYGIRHYRKVFEEAARYRIMIDNHEPVKPTGLCRTYPNFMTQEGGRGQEYDAWSMDGGNPPSYTTVIPFTRMLAGPFDFTPGTFNFENTGLKGTRVQTTLAKQLAMMVVIYSPLQMASDLPESYEGNPAFQFIKDVPCDWEETQVLNGEIGQYITIARKDRNAEGWYIGSITNEQERTLAIPLSFLAKGKKYTAQVYADGADADWKSNPTSIAITAQQVDAQSTLTLKLAKGGGAAVRIVPVK